LEYCNILIPGEKMKKIVLATFLFCSMGFAQTERAFAKLPEGTGSILQLINAQVLDAKDGCPEGATCVAPMTLVTIGFWTNCRNKVSPVTYDTKVLERETPKLSELQIGYTAYELVNEKPSDFTCQGETQHKVSLRVFGLFNQNQISLSSHRVSESEH
jgi:hypothetical protein